MPRRFLYLLNSHIMLEEGEFSNDSWSSASEAESSDSDDDNDLTIEEQNVGTGTAWQH